MNNGYIAVIDSGVGGISALLELIKLMPNERYLYYGDNENVPYGNKNKRELLSLCVSIINKIKRYPIKCVVVGCNTLSVMVLESIRRMFPELTFFGVYPPVEISLIQRKKTLLVCTKNTASLYNNLKALDVLVIPTLASEIERNALNLNEVDIKKHIYNVSVRESFNKNLNETVLTTKGTFLTTEKLKMIIDHQIPYYECIILGCTHYFFIKNQILNHFQPQIITRGEVFTAKIVSKFIIKSKTLVKHKRNNILFLGENSKYNEKVFNNFQKIR